MSAEIIEISDDEPEEALRDDLEETTRGAVEEESDEERRYTGDMETIEQVYDDAIEDVHFDCLPWSF